MLIVRLAGGLGNQIFQLGAGLLLAKKQNASRLILDSSGLSNYDVKRKNELASFFDFSKSEIIIEEKVCTINKLRIPIHLGFKIPFWPFVGDKNFQFILQSKIFIYTVLDGYFQESIVQDDFTYTIELLKNLYIPLQDKFKEGCVIHIRGGDFVTLGWNVITPREYYIKAIEKMKTTYNVNKFYVVTDDINYANTVLGDLNIEYNFISKSLYEDFQNIANYKYRILSASTFSLWASSLGMNDDSLVIAPNYWRPNVERKITIPNEIRL